MNDPVEIEEMQTLGSITGSLQLLGKGDGGGGGGSLAEMLSYALSRHVLEDEAFFRRVSYEL